MVRDDDGMDDLEDYGITIQLKKKELDCLIEILDEYTEQTCINEGLPCCPYKLKSQLKKIREEEHGKK